MQHTSISVLACAGVALEAVIASSSFNNRTELGTAAVAGAPAELTPHELASMLSFWLTDSPPTPTIPASASMGSALLGTRAGE